MSNAVLDFLRGSFSASSLGETFEYRLLLSGCAYNGDLQGDYSKSTTAVCCSMNHSRSGKLEARMTIIPKN